MRCNNCGFPNEPNAVKCTRCNYVIKGSLNISPSKGKDKKGSSEELGETIMAPPSNKTAHDKGIYKKDKAPTVKGGTNKPTMRDKTIGVQHESADPMKKLQLHRLDGNGNIEDHNISISSGGKMKLNRDNLDKKNNTITSKVQALISMDEKGRLFIENKSEYGSTYLVIQDKLELKDGDKVMLGNRVFLVKNDAEVQNADSKKTRPLG